MAKQNESVQPEKADVFTADEFAAAWRTLGVPSEVIVAAFKIAGITSATEATAKEIIENFLKREIRG